MKSSIIRFYTFLSLIVLLSACSDNTENPEPVTPLEVFDFSASVSQNPTVGQEIGTINARSGMGTVSFEIVSQNPEGAFDINGNTGKLFVANASLYVFAVNPELTAIITATDGVDRDTLMAIVSVKDPSGPEFNVWTGPTITFSKANGADPNLAQNQDRITNNVWITRDNDGGRIYNVVIDQGGNNNNRNVIPSDTEWARGTTANVANLNFDTFDEIVDPKNDIGDDFVLHLITDDVYIDIRFTSWTQGRNNGGGFSYERSSKP